MDIDSISLKGWRGRKLRSSPPGKDEKEGREGADEQQREKWRAGMNPHRSHSDAVEAFHPWSSETLHSEGQSRRAFIWDGGRPQARGSQSLPLLDQPPSNCRQPDYA